ncbi:MAG: bifunctional folylpolyglutamate synthase/dihydrofolate synthase, partial [Clostridia bacterium]|nr:bifunctional folylpolyglutamate synthase/dihydrofolate synthase [Clostridia bacterium]
MTYETAFKITNNLNNFNMLDNASPKIENMYNFMEIINNPEENLKFIHVAGTNGKGSTCYMLANILKHAGYKTGLYISPDIYDIRERIQINNKLISRKRFAELVDFINKIKKNNLSKFEFLTAMAFKYFSDEKCDIVVLETGLGGKFDATNIIKNNICSVITSISYDHTHILGDNLEQITAEKAGIIKPNSKVIVSPNQEKIVYEIIKKTCDLNNSKLIISSNKIKIKDSEKLEFTYKNMVIKTDLLGEYQKENICTVMSVIEAISDDFFISDESIKFGLENVKIPCRMEIINKKPLIILDAGHNISGAENLKQYINKRLKNRKITAVINIFRDKNINGMFRVVSGCFYRVVIVPGDSDRNMNCDELAEKARKYFSQVISCNKTNQVLDIIKNMLDNEV